MPISSSCATTAARVRPGVTWSGRLLAWSALAVLGACAVPTDARLAQSPATSPALAPSTTAPAVQATATPATSGQAQPLDTAVSRLATTLIADAKLDPGERRVLVVDPPVDRATVRHTALTREVEHRIAATVTQRFPNLQVSAFAQAALRRQPLMVLSCMTPVAAPGALATHIDTLPPRFYRIWASLSDTRTGRIVASETVWVPASEVDATPTKFFRDSPVWVMDHSMQAYLKVCGGKPGEAMDPAYLDGRSAGIAVDEATQDYEGGHYPEALAAYTQASLLPGGDQMRVWNGVYLANLALGRPREAERAFGQMVDSGLAQGTLAVKFVFRPASTQFWPDRAVSGQYPVWLRQIAQRTASRQVCLLVVGHTSPTGTAAGNEALSERRAQLVRGRIVRLAPVLQIRTEARGRGAREPIVGNGRDNASDLLDRRVEFEPRPCDSARAERAPGHV